MCGRKLHQQDKWIRDLNEYHEPKSRRCAHFTPVFLSVLLFYGYLKLLKATRKGKKSK